MKKEDKKSEKIITSLLAVVFALILAGGSLAVIKASSPKKSGRSVVLFGDSLMAYSQDGSSVASVLERQTGLDVLDLSFGGTLMSYIYEDSSPALQRNALSMYAISNAFVSDDFSWQNSFHTSEPATDYFEARIKEMNALDLKDTDIVIIGQCINDYHCAIPVGETASESEYTYCGALRKTILNIRKVNPDIRIIILSPTKKWLDDGSEALFHNYGGGTYEQFLSYQKLVAEQMGAEYISLYDLYDTPLEISGDETISGEEFTVDGTHPNLYGRQQIAGRISDYLKEK